MAFLNALHDRFQFYVQAIKDEYKRSRWFKAMTIAAPVYVFLVGFLITFVNPVPTWSWRSKIIILLSSLVMALCVAVEAAYRSAKRNESARPVIDVLIPQAFVRAVPGNRSICQVFLYVELQNKTPHRANFVRYALDFKVKEREPVRINKLLDLAQFQACSAIESCDDDYPEEVVITHTDCENMDDLREVLRTDSPVEGFPAVGWLGFIVRKSIVPYSSYQRGLGYGHPILTDEGEPTGDEEEATEPVYFPKFSAIEELKLIVVDGYQQSWSGVAVAVNPKGEEVIERPKPAAISSLV